MRPATAIVTALLSALLAPGCVTYVPVDVGAVAPDVDVRVRLTEDATVRLAPAFGRIRQEVDGNVQPVGQDSIELSIWIGRDHPGTAFQSARQVVLLDRQDVLQLHHRQLSVGRSAFAGAVVAATFVLLARQILQREDPNPPSDGDNGLPPPSGFQIPLVRGPLN